jgi:hypothetical protein
LFCFAAGFQIAPVDARYARFTVESRCCQLLGREEDGRGQHELHVWRFGVHSDSSELAFLSAVTCERKQILVFQVSFDFLEVGLQVYRHT